MRHLCVEALAWAILLCAGCLATAADPATRPAGPLTAAAALQSFDLEPGLAVSLVAAEPLVASPCAVAWDERGRMYVVENRGYPVGGPGGKPVGSVAVLEDTNGDGTPDLRCDYATGLSFPTGVLPWRGGVIVTDSPDVLYFKDADGDGRAEVREVLLTGFATDRSTQLRVNDPTLGPDGWVYLAGGLSGGKVRSPKRPDRVLDITRTDVKFRPDTGEVEPVDGKGQFGLTFDDAGNRFVCNNRVQVQHVPLPARYLARNPNVTSPGVLHNCPDLVRNLMLGKGNDAGARIYPISANLTTADSHAGTYSAACGVHVARGDALPAEYVGRAWSCDPTGNLARYDALQPVGGTFHAARVREGVEAFRSRDDWFRPVFLADGPDGALYVVDMYRKTIEHPEYLPEEVRKHTDFESGKDLGRIWRLARAGAEPAALAEAGERQWRAPAEAGGAELVAALSSANGWTRDTAFRLIVERGGAGSLAAPLQALASAADAPAPAAVSALNLLANAWQLSDATLLAATRHDDAAVRQSAARLAEPRLAQSRALAERVLELTGDAHVHVRYAAVLVAGEIAQRRGAEDAGGGGDAVIDALARAAASPDVNDKWFRAALCTSLPAPGGARRLLAKLTREPPATAGPATADGTAQLLQELGRLWAAEVGPEGWPAALAELTGMIGGYEFGGRAAVLAGFAERGGAAAAAELRAAAQRSADGPAARTTAEAARVAADAAAPLSSRVRAVELLALVGGEAGQSTLLSLVAPDQAAELAIAAARGLVQSGHGGGGGAAAGATLLEAERWARYTPALRSTVLTLLSARPEFAPAMVAALELRAVPVSALGEPQRAWLRRAEDPDVRARAEKLLSAAAGAAGDGDRGRAFEDAKAALRLAGRAAAGRAVFLNHCANCHRLDREGYAVGPDLYGIRNQPKESILLHIVIPEQEVAPNFAAYDCVTTDGRTLSGIMTADTPASITLRQALGIEETIPRENVKRLQANRYSLMPPGLEQAMSKQELADLLAYLRGEQ